MPNADGQTLNGQANSVSSAEISRAMRAIEPHADSRIETESESDRPLLQGAFVMRRFPDGLEMHAIDAVELQNQTVEFELPPGVSIFVLVDGYLSFSIDGAAWELGADEIENGNCGLIWSRTRATAVSRQMRKGRHVSKLTITLPPAWFDAYGVSAPQALEAMRTRHLAEAHWALSERAIRAAWDVIRPMEADPMSQVLAAHRNVLTVVNEAIGLFQDDAAEDVSAIVNPKAAEARAFLDATLKENLTLSEIARHLGLSVTGLQNVFRDGFQMTVGEYRRRQRLVRANVALRDDGASIAQAARLAGYGSAANFATAFKRAFGYPPSQARK